MHNKIAWSLIPLGLFRLLYHNYKEFCRFLQFFSSFLFFFEWESKASKLGAFKSNLAPDQSKRYRHFPPETFRKVVRLSFPMNSWTQHSPLITIHFFPSLPFHDKIPLTTYILSNLLKVKKMTCKLASGSENYFQKVWVQSWKVSTSSPVFVYPSCFHMRNLCYM